MEDLYCILPSGNRGEFFGLDCELIRRGVDAQISELPSGGRLYRIPLADTDKLPFDEKGPYLGDDNSGHSIYKLGGAEYTRVDWGGSEWISLLQISQEAKNVVEENRSR